jgi:hypothetical protein
MKQKNFLKIILFGLILFLGMGSSFGQVIITEIADPNNESNARFVEIYNIGPSSVDLTGWELRRYTNDSSSPQVSGINLSSVGVLAVGNYVIVARDATTFQSVYGFAPTLTGSSGSAVDSNGDDKIAILNASDTIIDIFGTPGSDSNNENSAMNFEDGRTERISSVTAPNSTWTASEWDTDNDQGFGSGAQDAPGGFDPGIWIGASSAPQIASISNSPITPISSDAVTVSADITDTDGIASASINWGTTSGNLTNMVAMSISSGDTYQGSIPAQANGTTVFYEIEATDSNASPETSTSAEQSYIVTDPTPGITLGTVSGNTNESGTTATFTVVIDTQPTTDVVVNISSGDTGEVTVNAPTALTFTNANWDNPQTVTVTGVDDADVDGNVDVTITVAVDDALSDNAYDSVDDVTTTVTNEDDEVAPAGLQISSANTNFVIDFDNTVSGINNGQFNGSGFTPTPSSGQLDSDAWKTTGMSEGNTAFGDSNSSEDFAKGDSSGGVSSGGFYAFETLTSNYSLGFQPTGSDFSPGTITLRTQNQTGATITAIYLSYIIYVLNNEDRTNTLNFEYSTDDTTYTPVGSLDFTSTETQDGSPSWISNNRSTNVSGLSIADGEYFYLRWASDNVGGSGSQDEFAIDDITLNFNPFSAWTGNTDTDWATAGNWSNGVPAATTDVTIPAGLTNYPTVTTAETVNSLTIASGATLVATNASFTVTNNATYSRNLASGSQWYLMSSPVNGENYNNDWVTANSIPSSSQNTDNRGISWYDNSSSDTDTDGAGTSDSATGYWRYMEANNDTPFAVGRGYGVIRSGSGDITFIGTGIYTSSQTFLLAMGENNFNLVGNPFTASLNLGDFFGDNGADVISGAQVWLWNGSSYDVKMSGTDNSFEIAPTQGFFVEAAAATNLTFDINDVSHTAATFQRNSSKTEITLSLAEGTQKRNAHIYYLDEATTSYDLGFDGKLFGGVPHNIAIYTDLIVSNGKKYQVQSLPNKDQETMVVPVGVIAESNKEITFTAEALNLPSGLKVFLEDRFTNTFTRLDEANSAYTIALTEKLDGVGRFYLHTKASALNIDEVQMENISMYTSNASTLRIVGLPQGKASITLFNILGKQVLQTSFTSNGAKDITLPNVSAGIYIVQLKTATGQLNQKITLD